MTVEIKVPQLPESIADATIVTWYKKPGDTVKRDENLVDIETDKVVLEVVAPNDGVLEQILKDKGSIVKAEEIIGTFAPGATAKAESPAAAPAAQHTMPAATTETEPATDNTKYAPQPQPNASTQPAVAAADAESLSPSERRALKEQAVSPSQAAAPAATNTTTAKSEAKSSNETTEQRLEKRVPMTRLRAKVAERLLAAQHNAAILTTFNEINMAPVIALRNAYKEEFMQRYNARLGYMGFFVTAVVAALKRFPIINASIDGNDVVYHGYFDIGIAVSTERGLVVPVLRDADTLTMAEIEQKIADFGQRAKSGKLTMEELTGGTFTITNGGVYGSLMSTPIINPPQSAILGVHKIQERPVVENKEIVIRPMTYVALSYDHRLIDGAESVQFLVAIKELLEDPARLLLSI